jgi:hypothetical protein
MVSMLTPGYFADPADFVACARVVDLVWSLELPLHSRERRGHQ